MFTGVLFVFFASVWEWKFEVKWLIQYFDNCGSFTSQFY
jgi:hypothetical protein